MKAFVTGGTGFVGSHLVEALLARGDDVVCLVRDPGKARRLFGERTPTLVQGDMSDVGALASAAEGADVIFHVAALTAARNEREFLDVNVGGTERVLAAAPAGISRFVHVSSLAAAGPSRRGRALQGGEPEKPVTPYGASKLAAEQAVRASRIPWTIVRPPTVYGPRDRELLRLFRLVRFGIAPVFGDGSQELSVVYVEDLVRALVEVVSAPTEGKIYYANHPDIVRSRALVKAAHRAIGGRRGPLVIPMPALLARPMLWLTGTAVRIAGRTTLLSSDKADEFLAEAWTCSPAALMRDTTWTPSYDLSTGFSKTADWYRKHGWL